MEARPKRRRMESPVNESAQSNNDNFSSRKDGVTPPASKTFYPSNSRSAILPGGHPSRSTYAAPAIPRPRHHPPNITRNTRYHPYPAGYDYRYDFSDDEDDDWNGGNSKAAGPPSFPKHQSPRQREPLYYPSRNYPLFDRDAYYLARDASQNGRPRHHFDHLDSVAPLRNGHVGSSPKPPSENHRVNGEESERNTTQVSPNGDPRNRSSNISSIPADDMEALLFRPLEVSERLDSNRNRLPPHPPVWPERRIRQYPVSHHTSPNHPPFSNNHPRLGVLPHHPSSTWPSRIQEPNFPPPSYAAEQPLRAPPARFDAHTPPQIGFTPTVLPGKRRTSTHSGSSNGGGGGGEGDGEEEEGDDSKKGPRKTPNAFLLFLHLNSTRIIETLALFQLKRQQYHYASCRWKEMTDEERLPYYEIQRDLQRIAQPDGPLPQIRIHRNDKRRKRDASPQTRSIMQKIRFLTSDEVKVAKIDKSRYAGPEYRRKGGNGSSPRRKRANTTTAPTKSKKAPPPRRPLNLCHCDGNPSHESHHEANCPFSLSWKPPKLPPGHFLCRLQSCRHENAGDHCSCHCVNCFRHLDENETGGSSYHYEHRASSTPAEFQHGENALATSPSRLDLSPLERPTPYPPHDLLSPPQNRVSNGPEADPIAAATSPANSDSHPEPREGASRQRNVPSTGSVARKLSTTSLSTPVAAEEATSPASRKSLFPRPTDADIILRPQSSPDSNQSQRIFNPAPPSTQANPFPRTSFNPSAPTNSTEIASSPTSPVHNPWRQPGPLVRSASFSGSPTSPSFPASEIRRSPSRSHPPQMLEPAFKEPSQHHGDSMDIDRRIRDHVGDVSSRGQGLANQAAGVIANRDPPYVTQSFPRPSGSSSNRLEPENHYERSRVEYQRWAEYYEQYPDHYGHFSHPSNHHPPWNGYPSYYPPQDYYSRYPAQYPEPQHPAEPPPSSHARAVKRRTTLAGYPSRGEGQEVEYEDGPPSHPYARPPAPYHSGQPTPTGRENQRRVQRSLPEDSSSSQLRSDQGRERWEMTGRRPGNQGRPRRSS